MPEKRKHKKKSTSKKRLPRKIEKSKTIIEISEMHKWFGSFHDGTKKTHEKLFKSNRTA